MLFASEGAAVADAAHGDEGLVAGQLAGAAMYRAKELGRDPLEVRRELVRTALPRTFKTIWRVFLKFTSDEALVALADRRVVLMAGLAPLTLSVALAGTGRLLAGAIVAVMGAMSAAALAPGARANSSRSSSAVENARALKDSDGSRWLFWCKSFRVSLRASYMAMGPYWAQAPSTPLTYLYRKNRLERYTTSSVHRAIDFNKTVISTQLSSCYEHFPW